MLQPTPSGSTDHVAKRLAADNPHLTGEEGLYIEVTLMCGKNGLTLAGNKELEHMVDEICKWAGYSSDVKPIISKPGGHRLLIEFAGRWSHNLPFPESIEQSHCFQLDPLNAIKNAKKGPLESPPRYMQVYVDNHDQDRKTRAETLSEVRNIIHERLVYDGIDDALVRESNHGLVIIELPCGINIAQDREYHRITETILKGGVIPARLESIY